MGRLQTAGYVCVIAATLIGAFHHVGLVQRVGASETPEYRDGHREQLEDPFIPGSRSRSTTLGAVVERNGFVSVQVNTDSSGNNILGDAANEPSIAVDPVDPRRMAIGWRQFDTIASNFRQAGWAYSHDGGESWTFPGVLEPGIFRSDPVLASDAKGHFYYCSLRVDPYRCTMFKSTDGGVTWPIQTPAYGGDKEWMTIDRTQGIGRGNIYVTWQWFFGQTGLDALTRSNDGGFEFESPVEVPPYYPVFGTLDVGPDGALYISGIEALTGQDFDEIVLLRSSNAQDPRQNLVFEHAIVVDMGGYLEHDADPNPGGLAGQVWVATDHSNGPTAGNLYLMAPVNPPGPDPLDIMFASSTDRGVTWSDPIRINDDPEGAYQWFAAMSVAPNGRIDIIWNDTRHSGSARLSELFYSYSMDGGQTWSDNTPTTPVFDTHVGWPNQNKIGDYYDMVSDNLGASVAYSATFNGEQDVYYMRIGQSCLDTQYPGFADCDQNGVNDACQTDDCNHNDILDDCDIQSGTSPDVDGNGIPDECYSTLRVPQEYTTIQAAVDAARVDDVVLVSPGTYHTSQLNLGYRILLKSTHGAAATILEGDTRQPILDIKSQAGALNGTVIDGFTFKGGSTGIDTNRSITLRNCIVTENQGGGGVVLWSTRGVLDNTLLYGNRYTGSRSGGGGALTVRGNGSLLDMNGCTISNNGARSGSGGVYIADEQARVQMKSSILWNNVSQFNGDNQISIAGNGDEPGTWLEVQYSDVQGGLLGVSAAPDVVLEWGPGNLDLPPRFRRSPKPSTHQIPDYRLRADSPCINTGFPDLLPRWDARDLEGDPRVLAGRVDIGADEFTYDCNVNQVSDLVDIESGKSPDCNQNSIPDECDVNLAGRRPGSEDHNANGIPDECESDLFGLYRD